MGCSPSTLSRHSEDTISTNTISENTKNSHHHDKKGNILCCLKKRPSFWCQGSQQHGTEANVEDENIDTRRRSSITALDGDDFCNHALLSTLQTKGDNVYDKGGSCTKKDAIVTVSALTHFTQAVMKRARGSTAASGASDSSGGYRKNSVTFVSDDDYLDGTVMDSNYPTVVPPNPQLKALLVFHKMDSFCQMLQQTCNHQNLDIMLARTKESALQCINKTTDDVHVVIIDARSTKYIDVENVIKSIRLIKGHHYTTIIAVVKKNFFEKEDFIVALLDAGVNRCLFETTSVALCCLEMKQIISSVVRPNHVMSTQEVLYAGLNRIKEAILVTDDKLTVQYVNRSAERLFRMRFGEIIGKPVADIFISDISSIYNMCQTQCTREYDSNLIIKRKDLEGVSMQVRVLPVACVGRNPTHYIFNINALPSNITSSTSHIKEVPRGSAQSVRRYSLDRRSTVSDGLRRPSLAKITSLPLEAPITKVINLLTQVQDNCSQDEARLIDRVMDFLKREGLFKPHMKDLQTEDPTAKDLIGALLAGPSVQPARRSSNDSFIRFNQNPTRIAHISASTIKEKEPIAQLLGESLSWEFDIFRFEEITEKQPLLYLGMDMFRRYNVFATLNVEECICRNWLATIESHYHADNSYHNSTHAADVMQATGVFLKQFSVKDLVLDGMEQASALIAAAAHDVDHPGRSSAFLCNADSPLAILYNDVAVLESHHSALTFKLTLEDESINIFKNLEKDVYKSVRSTIVDMILATEMTKHFEHLAKFVSVFGTDLEPKEMVHTEEESSILVRRMLIKVADINNPARPTPFSVEWGRRIAEEYFMQTDEEKKKNLPIVMPMFDRNTCSIPKSQIGFIEYIIHDMMHAWDSFVDMPELMVYLQTNYELWKSFEEQGIRTLSDVKAKQLSLKRKMKNTK